MSSIYNRLGGDQGIKTLTDLIFQHMRNHRETEQFFKFMNLDRLKVRVVSFLGDVFGGQRHDGPDMRTSHSFLNLTDRHFNLMIEAFTFSLSKMGIKSPTREDVLKVVKKYRKQIVVNTLPTAMKKRKSRSKGRRVSWGPVDIEEDIEDLENTTWLPGSEDQTRSLSPNASVREEVSQGSQTPPDTGKQKKADKAPRKSPSPAPEARVPSQAKKTSNNLTPSRPEDRDRRLSWTDHMQNIEMRKEATNAKAALRKPSGATSDLALSSGERPRESQGRPGTPPPSARGKESNGISRSLSSMSRTLSNASGPRAPTPPPSMCDFSDDSCANSFGSSREPSLNSRADSPRVSDALIDSNALREALRARGGPVGREKNDIAGGPGSTPRADSSLTDPMSNAGKHRSPASEHKTLAETRSEGGDLGPRVLPTRQLFRMEPSDQPPSTGPPLRNNGRSSLTVPGGSSSGLSAGGETGKVGEKQKIVRANSAGIDALQKAAAGEVANLQEWEDLDDSTHTGTGTLEDAQGPRREDSSGSWIKSPTASPPLLEKGERAPLHESPAGSDSDHLRVRRQRSPSPVGPNTAAAELRAKFDALRVYSMQLERQRDELRSRVSELQRSEKATRADSAKLTNKDSSPLWALICRTRSGRSRLEFLPLRARIFGTELWDFVNAPLFRSQSVPYASHAPSAGSPALRPQSRPRLQS